MTSFLADFKHSTAAEPLATDTKAMKADNNEMSPPGENKRWNLLHSASEGGDVAIIETMLSLGLDIDSRDSFGTTPFLVAAASGKMQAVNFLLVKGADLSLTTYKGRNLLHAAAEGGKVSIVQTLLSQSNIAIDSRDDDEITSLMIAASNNNLEVVEYLLGKGADPSLKNKQGRNVLFIASGHGSIATIARLLSCFSIDSRDDDGDTPLMHAAACAQLPAVNYLLEKGADPLLTGKSGWSLLHFAAQGGNVAIIETILSYGSGVDSRDSNTGQTPLVVTTGYNNVEAMNYLFDKGANPYLKDN